MLLLGGGTFDWERGCILPLAGLLRAEGASVLRDGDIKPLPAGHTRGAIGVMLSDFRLLVRQTGFRAAVKEFVPATVGRVQDKVYSRQTALTLVKLLRTSDARSGCEAAHRRLSANGDFRVERVREDHADDLVRLRMAQDSFNPGQAANIVDHIGRGYQGFVLRREEEVIGHFWWIDTRIAPKHPHLADYHIELADDDVYCFEYFIAPRHRGGGVAIDALQVMEAELRELGYKRAWGVVDADNTPARWLYMMSGWSVAHTVTTLRVLTRRRATVAGAAPDGS